MAVSVSASSVSSFDTEPFARLAAAAATFSSSCSTKLSSLSSLEFPVWTLLLRIGTATSARRRIVPLVEAKKQTFSSFDNLLANSDKPVLFDFYAAWCGPCQFMVPVLNEVSTRLQDTIKLVKIDTEKYPSIAGKYRIEALPTFVVFKDGKPYDRFEGAMTADQLSERIEAGLKAKQHSM